MRPTPTREKALANAEAYRLKNLGREEDSFIIGMIEALDEGVMDTDGEFFWLTEKGHIMSKTTKAIYDRVEKARAKLDACLVDLVKMEADRPDGFLGDYLTLATDENAKVINGDLMEKLHTVMDHVSKSDGKELMEYLANPDGNQQNKHIYEAIYAVTDWLDHK